MTGLLSAVFLGVRAGRRKAATESRPALTPETCLPAEACKAKAGHLTPTPYIAALKSRCHR